MKRLLSAFLTLIIALGSFPAHAQTIRVAVQAGSAPVPVPSGLVSPVGGILPTLSAPLLSPSMSFGTSLPSPSVAVQAVSVHALAINAVAVNAAPALDSPQANPAPIPAPEHQKAAADTLFDGANTRSAASIAEPPRAPAPAPRKSLLQRYRNSRDKNPLQNAFGVSMFATTMAAASVPVLWGAVPALKYAYAMTAADLLMLAIIVPLSVGTAVWRKLRPQTAAKPPPSRRAKLAVIALGAILGLGAATAPYQAVGPVVETVRSVVDIRKPAAQRDSVRFISGGAVEDETRSILAVNPVGREILRQLTDRGGTLRLPPFFISNQDGSYAQHESFYDGVYLNANELTKRGWTAEQFLQDPALQRQLIREMSSTVVHELMHSVQGRRPPWTKGYFSNSIEAEQEAFFKEQRARWPAYRVHLYQLLAARADTPGMAKMYMDKAKAAAKEAGLPEPSGLVASR